MFAALVGSDPEKLFLVGPVVAILSILLIFWVVKNSREMESGFKLRESERVKKAAEKSAKTETTPKGPFRLTGIRIDGKAHEILGLTADASEPEILKSYRNLMKQYHPDKIGPIGTRQWTDAQKIAEAINRAKAEMLKSLHENASNRSGR